MSKNVIITILLIALLGVLIVIILSFLHPLQVQEHQIVIKPFEYAGRCTHITEKLLIVGNNEKEIKNDYYDFKIESSDTLNIIVFINKLWIENNSHEVIDYQYAQHVCEYLSKMLNLPYDYITNLVCENYIRVRQYEEVYKVEKFEDISIKLTRENNQLIMEISSGEKEN